VNRVEPLCGGAIEDRSLKTEERNSKPFGSVRGEAIPTTLERLRTDQASVQHSGVVPTNVETMTP